MVHTPTLNTFLDLHRDQLTASGVPEIYWPTLFQKLVNQNFDAGTAFQLLQIEYDEKRQDHEPIWALQAIRDIQANDQHDIYLIDHAWTFRVSTAKNNLIQYPNLRNRMCRILGIDENLGCETVADEIFKQMWKVCNTYSISNMVNIEDRLPIWYVMDEIGLAVVHSDKPNCRIVPFVDYNYQATYSLLFPIQDVEEGTTLLRDYAEGISDPVDRAAALIPWKPHCFEDVSINPPLPGPDYYLKGHIEESLPDLEKCKSHVLEPKNKYKVFTEYDLVKEHLLQNDDEDQFEIVEDEEEADILWYTRHFKDYYGLSQTPHKFVNQFPFEYVMTVKDLLSITCRRSGEEPAPKWMPITYNLVTEIANFISYYDQRKKSGEENFWIIKPYNLARSLDTHVTNNLNYIVRLPATGPKIAQKYIANPVLFSRPDCSGKVKFDIRYVVLLKSVHPLQVYVYKNFFLRFANKPFMLSEFDDYQRHFTVMNYDEKVALKHMLCSEFKNAWEEEYPDIFWNNVEKSIFDMLKNILQCATIEKPPCGIAESPQSKALYAADIMLEWNDEGKIQPKILEMNWTPDCKRACDYYPDFFRNIFNLLFLNKSCDDFCEL